MTTDTATQEAPNLRVPMTGENDSCYLCDNDATHVGHLTFNIIGAEVGLCEGCYLREIKDVPTTIEKEETTNHKKITYSDGSTCYTYEDEDGYYAITECPIFGTWEESGPFNLPNIHAEGDVTVEDIPKELIPGVAGNTTSIDIEILSVEADTESGWTALCPECETQSTEPTKNEAWAVAKRHNEIRHTGERIAGIPRNQLSG